MRLSAGLCETDRVVTQQAASRIRPRVAMALSAVEETAESTKLWCGAATVMAVFGGGAAVRRQPPGWRRWRWRR